MLRNLICVVLIAFGVTTLSVASKLGMFLKEGDKLSRKATVSFIDFEVGHLPVMLPGGTKHIGGNGFTCLRKGDDSSVIKGFNFADTGHPSENFDNILAACGEGDGVVETATCSERSGGVVSNYLSGADDDGTCTNGLDFFEHMG